MRKAPGKKSQFKPVIPTDEEIDSLVGIFTSPEPEQVQVFNSKKLMVPDDLLPNLEEGITEAFQLFDGTEPKNAENDLGLEGGLESGLEGGLGSGLEGGLESGLEGGLESGLESGLGSGLEGGLEGGLGSVPEAFKHPNAMSEFHNMSRFDKVGEVALEEVQKRPTRARAKAMVEEEEVEEEDEEEEDEDEEEEEELHGNEASLVNDIDIIRQVCIHFGNIGVSTPEENVLYSQEASHLEVNAPREKRSEQLKDKVKNAVSFLLLITQHPKAWNASFIKHLGFKPGYRTDAPVRATYTQSVTKPIKLRIVEPKTGAKLNAEPADGVKINEPLEIVNRESKFTLQSGEDAAKVPLMLQNFANDLGLYEFTPEQLELLMFRVEGDKAILQIPHMVEDEFVLVDSGPNLDLVFAHNDFMASYLKIIGTVLRQKLQTMFDDHRILLADMEHYSQLIGDLEGIIASSLFNTQHFTTRIENRVIAKKIISHLLSRIFLADLPFSFDDTFIQELLKDIILNAILNHLNTPTQTPSGVTDEIIQSVEKKNKQKRELADAIRESGLSFFDLERNLRLSNGSLVEKLNECLQHACDHLSDQPHGESSMLVYVKDVLKPFRTPAYKDKTHKWVYGEEIPLPRNIRVALHNSAVETGEKQKKNVRQLYKYISELISKKIINKYPSDYREILRGGQFQFPSNLTSEELRHLRLISGQVITRYLDSEVITRYPDSEVKTMAISANLNTPIFEELKLKNYYRSIIKELGNTVYSFRELMDISKQLLILLHAEYSKMGFDPIDITKIIEKIENEQETGDHTDLFREIEDTVNAIYDFQLVVGEDARDSPEVIGEVARSNILKLFGIIKERLNESMNAPVAPVRTLVASHGKGGFSEFTLGRNRVSLNELPAPGAAQPPFPPHKGNKPKGLDTPNAKRPKSRVRTPSPHKQSVKKGKGRKRSATVKKKNNNE